MPVVHVVRRRFLAGVIVVAALAALGAAALHLWPADAESKAAAAPPQLTPVPVATVVEAAVVMWDEFSGRLEAVERVDVRSRVAGAILSVHFVEGALVNRGDLLITIDPAPYAADAERAQAQVAAAQARVTYTKSEHERAQRLLEGNAIPRREFDQRANAFQEAEANLRATEAALQSARLNLGYTQVRAPVSGRVGKLDVTVGNLVAAGPSAPVLTTLVSVNPIYASFDADEQVVARALKEVAAPGKRLQSIPVEMSTAIDSTTFHGHLQLVDNQVNTKSGTVRVRAVFDNKDGMLMPGQFARVRMGQSKTTPALLINERAVGTDQNKKFVMVVGPDNKVGYREVSLGGSANGLRIVTSGLNPGERIVVGGLQRIRPGSLIDPQPTVMEAGHPQAQGKVLAKS
jgi:membrane fusion protein, multidrug efflux system